MLSLLHEALAPLGRALVDEARTVLQAQRGSSKTAKLARALLALEGQGGAALAEARLGAWEARVGWAEAVLD